MALSKGLSADSETLVTQLRDYLEHYQENDIVRELLQNADDAGAKRLYFYILANGEKSPCHPLLSQPALLVLYNV